jgi:chaperone required for assembly of F1-ATPase
MREFIEDAHRHRDDGYGRAQAHARPDDLPRRFYKTTGIAPVDGGYAVTLDDRPSRTPGRVPVVVPNEALARLLAAEWAAQGERINATTMPIVRLVNSAVESGEASLSLFRAELLKFAASDLLLYRAETPRELIEAEELLWDAVMVKLARHFGVAFQATLGIIHVAQPPATLARLGESLGGEGLLAMTALVSITSLTGSGLLAIALRQGLLGADEAWTTAHVDEDYNMRLWGAMDEAVARRARRRLDFDAAVIVLEHLDRPA